MLPAFPMQQAIQYQGKPGRQRQADGKRHIGGSAASRAAISRPKRAEQLHQIRSLVLDLADQRAVDHQIDLVRRDQEREEIPGTQRHSQQRRLDPGQQAGRAQGIPQAQQAEHHQQQRDQLTAEQMALHQLRHAKGHGRPLGKAGLLGGIYIIQAHQHQGQESDGRVLAHRGADVGADQPVNYALRNAVEDLRQFEDCDEVLSVFYDSAYRAYEYNDGLYAIPETQTYNVMFYRKDILEELGLTVPDTWDELVDMLPTIQGNNMEVGIPSTASTTLPDLSLFYTLLYQGGSDVYDDEAKKTIIDNEAGVNAFATYTSFFNDYGMPTEYDFVSRFRSGQMPIGIANYSIYNTLVVSAPEIRGLWDFTLIPATEVTDETGAVTKNRSVYSTGTCSMMIKTEDETVRQNAWTFMKWWAQTDTQVRFGRELEALLGSSARYATANREAFDQLAWSADDVEVLEEQWKSAVGFREVAGGYYTGRHIVNAVRKVINEKEDPRETILDYAITINDELIKKRTEFGLPTD